MEHVEAGDLRFPVVGLGTWQLRGPTCRQAVARALELGYRHVDTARIYRNEVEVGRGLRDSGVDRDEILVTTKVPGSQADLDGVRRAVDGSLADLGLDHLDVLLLHQPGPTPLEETMAAFRAEQESGRVRHVGLSNVGVADLDRAVREGPLVTVQNEHHPGRPDHAVRRWCRDRGLAFTAYSPLGTGAEVSRDTLTEIGRRHGKTPAQVLLRWLVQQQAVITIPRSGRADHLAENLEVFDFELDDHEAERIGPTDGG